jgi:nitrate/TMAO reductase-like tetraheme cytochrome c subunit
MIEPERIVYALIGITIVLVAYVAFRPAVTHGPREKILAFVALFIFPGLSLALGMNIHMGRAKQTQFCISCHSMANYGKSLYADDPHYLPAAHFQNHHVPPDEACWACHSDYTIFGQISDKVQSLERLYVEYLGTVPQPIKMPEPYPTRLCLQCHAGARVFEENPTHSAIMDSLRSNQRSCLSSGCHDVIHNAGGLDKIKMWSPGQ